jgi:hypothetical protein
MKSASCWFHYTDIPLCTVNKILRLKFILFVRCSAHENCTLYITIYVFMYTYLYSSPFFVLVQVKSSCSLVHVVKVYGRVEAHLHSFLALALDEMSGQPLSPAALSTVKQFPVHAEQEASWAPELVRVLCSFSFWR